MDTISKSILSTELQELYLQNKEWMSHVLFLEDESRFFQKLFGQKLFVIGKNNSIKQIDLITDSLNNLQERTIKLKALVTKHQHLLESILKDAELEVGLGLIEEHTAITAEIKQLFYSERLIKGKLFAMIEAN